MNSIPKTTLVKVAKHQPKMLVHILTTNRASLFHENRLAADFNEKISSVIGNTCHDLLPFTMATSHMVSLHTPILQALDVRPPLRSTEAGLKHFSLLPTISS